MERRPLLAAVASAAALPVAGCTGPTRITDSADPEPDSADPADTPTRTVVPDDVSYPERPTTALSPDRARRFVERHEAALVRDDLLSRGDRPVVELTVDEPRAVVVREIPGDDEGGAGAASGPAYVLVSACGGDATYRADPDGSQAGYGVNSYGVTHYLSADEHVRVVYNGFACENNRREPYRSTTPARNRDPSATAAPARLQLFDFGAEPARVRLGVTDAAGGGLVVREDYPFYKPEPDHRFRLLVQPRVTVAAGAYRLHVDVAGGGSTTADWSLPDRDAPPWWGTCVGVRPDGEPVVYTVDGDADGRLSFEGVHCELLDRETDA
jgi:hypothetical protein